MKNFLVTSLYKVKGWRDTEGDVYSVYKQMLKIMYESYAMNLEGEWEFVVFEDEVDDVQDVFIRNFHRLRDLWLNNTPCNILYCGPDTIMIKPTKVFGQYKHFLMFNYGCDGPYGLRTFYEENRHNLRFDHYLNADVRYYPAEMEPRLWEIGYKLFTNFDRGLWDTEQLIWNYMVWSQGLAPSEVIKPHMAYQTPLAPYVSIELQNEWNNCNIREANIIHLHGTRGAVAKLQFMIQLNDAFNIHGIKNI